ncbi:hypothetical protein AQ619_03000 [Caulobacter henricii]|uniref:Alginate lyase domain-containing protein n=1 Tax=Caulobacter henricii TaxID=69395 RepID=A0A0P0NXF2_9CAUL|nr:hypothetical protein AQ619_03000 [Caulobacter henricii]
MTLDAGDRDQAALSEADAVNAYANALAWRLTGNKTYFRQASGVLSNLAHFQGFTGGTDQDKLHAGWVGVLYGEAAEIMRSSADFRHEDITALQLMFRRAFYPQLMTPSSWNGNVDLTQINALMTLAVFNDDEVAFKLGLERLDARLATYIHVKSEPDIAPIVGDGGNLQSFWFNPVEWVDGLTQETCRDNGHHAQFGMASALNAAEIAWNQGVDVYGKHEARLVPAMELLAKQLLTGDMQGVCRQSKSSTTLFNTFEVGFHHYHHRMGLPLPNSEKLIVQRIRTDGQSVLNIFHETLTHAR